MTHDEVTMLIARIAGAWPTPTMEKETVLMYTEHLIELDPRDAQVALHSLLRTKSFRPAIADFHIAAKDARRERAALEKVEKEKRELEANYGSVSYLPPHERPVPTWKARRMEAKADALDTPEKVAEAKAEVLRKLAELEQEGEGA